jgi:hypothetical protein
VHGNTYLRLGLLLIVSTRGRGHAACVFCARDISTPETGRMLSSGSGRNAWFCHGVVSDKGKRDK